MFITKKHLSRRTVLRGVGASLALPLLDSMIPARTALAATAAAAKPRMDGVGVCASAVAPAHIATSAATARADTGRNANVMRSFCRSGRCMEMCQACRGWQPASIAIPGGSPRRPPW